MRAKREDNCSAVPSRHVILRQACAGRPIASFLTEIGRCLLSRHSNFGGRPLPDHVLGGRGPVPAAQTDVCGWMPATKLRAKAVHVSPQPEGGHTPASR